jgi:hypothetical protein
MANKIIFYGEELLDQRPTPKLEVRLLFFYCIRQILEKKWGYNETVHQLFIDLKKTYVSVRREVLYNIRIEFGATIKLFRLIKMCLNETDSKVRIGKHLSDKSDTHATYSE